MEVNVKFAKVRPNAIIPSKRDEDMGFDIYACFDEDYMVIGPHETKLIPTGIASACDPGYGFLLFERGSTGSKGIARRCGVIDSGYRNEWFVGLTNTTERSLVISKLNKIATAMRMCDVYDEEDFMVSEDDIDECMFVYPYSKAIVQALITPVPKANREEISYEELKAIPSERGLGALGSSGK
jgi:dUTP pyrophosphatase